MSIVQDMHPGPCAGFGPLHAIAAPGLIDGEGSITTDGILGDGDTEEEEESQRCHEAIDALVAENVLAGPPRSSPAARGGNILTLSERGANPLVFANAVLLGPSLGSAVGCMC